MIHKHDNATQTKWDKGGFQVQLVSAQTTQCIGFCDGSDADLAELRSIAEVEGAEEFSIKRKRLKTGREIWTLG